jgi:MFS family permease
MWALARPGLTWHLYLGYLVVGATTAGFQLMQFNLMLRLAPAELRAAYVAVFLALTSFMTAAGPVLGGQLLKHAPLELGHIFGYAITSYHLLFALSGCGCLLASNLVRQVREPAEGEVISVWREMRTMKNFNPMLSVLAVGELMLTPRGLFALGRRSLRSVRQQVKAIEEVGEEILAGGRGVLSSPAGLLKRDEKSDKKAD